MSIPNRRSPLNNSIDIDEMGDKEQILYLRSCFPKKKGENTFWSLHFGSSQFSPCYFQIAVNLVSTVNLLTENAYVANSVHYWHT